MPCTSFSALRRSAPPSERPDALEVEADCAAVLQQIAAVKGAVSGLMDEVLEAHLQQHVAAPGLTDAARAQGAQEVLAAIRRYGK